MLTMPQQASQRRALPQVTLCCVDTRTPELALYAMRRSMQALDFGHCVLLSTAAARSLPLQGIELIEIPPIASIDAYSRLVLKELHPLVRTSHILLIQWDGFVRDAKLWSDDFLAWDYIGAPWVCGDLAGQVGNGGFSLRSRRLMHALQSDGFPAHNPEDVCLAVTHKQALSQQGIRIADLPTAQRFACERGPWREAFGFHAMFNLPHVLPPDELRRFVEALPTGMCGSPDARHLLKNLIREGQLDAAQVLLDQRVRLRGQHIDAWRMQCRLAWRRLSARRLHP